MLARPRCPECHRRLSLVESYRARLSAFACPRCGTALRIPKGGSVALAIPLYLAFRLIFKTAWPVWQQVSLVLAIGIGVIVVEYLSVNTIAYRRAEKS